MDFGGRFPFRKANADAVLGMKGDRIYPGTAAIEAIALRGGFANAISFEGAIASRSQ